MSSSQAARRISSAKSTPAIGKPPPAPPAHPVVSTNFVTGLNNPEGLAVDQNRRDLRRRDRRRRTHRALRLDRGAAQIHRRPGRRHQWIPNSGHGAAPKRGSPSTAPAVSSTARSTRSTDTVGRRLLRGGGDARRTDRIRRGLRRRRRPEHRRSVSSGTTATAACTGSSRSAAPPRSAKPTTPETTSLPQARALPRRGRHRRSRVSQSRGRRGREAVQHLRFRGLTVAATAGTEVAGTEPRGLERPRHRRPLQRRRQQDRRLRLGRQ